MSVCAQTVDYFLKISVYSVLSVVGFNNFI